MQQIGSVLAGCGQAGKGTEMRKGAAAWAKTPCFYFLRMENFKLHNILQFAQVFCKKCDETDKK